MKMKHFSGGVDDRNRQGDIVLVRNRDAGFNKTLRRKAGDLRHVNDQILIRRICH
jgi:hypothetical protein